MRGAITTILGAAMPSARMAYGVGAISGAILGNVISRGDSSVLGTILGATAGALIGQQIDRGEARCR